MATPGSDLPLPEDHSEPLNILGAEEQWADPISQAQAVASDLAGLTEGDWAGEGLAKLHRLRLQRADSPLVLAATEAALTSDPVVARQKLEAFSISLFATDWARDIAARLAELRTVAITSLGSGTLMVLDEATRIGAPRESIVVNRSYLARGIGYLKVAVIDGSPTEADAVLAAGVASHDTTMWTTSHIADVMVRARVHGSIVVTVIHPLAELSPLNREAYRPARYLVQADR